MAAQLRPSMVPMRIQHLVLDCLSIDQAVLLITTYTSATENRIVRHGRSTGTCSYIRANGVVIHTIHAFKLLSLHDALVLKEILEYLLRGQILLFERNVLHACYLLTLSYQSALHLCYLRYSQLIVSVA